MTLQAKWEHGFSKAHLRHNALGALEIWFQDSSHPWAKAEFDDVGIFIQPSDTVNNWTKQVIAEAREEQRRWENLLANLQLLKDEWIKDPIWDIEDTEGFEEFHDALLAWRQRNEVDAYRTRTQRLRNKSLALGVPGAAGLVNYIETLEARILELESWRKTL